MAYTTKEVSKRLGVTTQTIINWTERGLLKCVRTPGGHRRYDAQEIEEFSNRYTFEQSKEDVVSVQNSGHVIILSHDHEYARLIKDFIQTCFQGFQHAAFDDDSFKLVSSPFRAAYWLGASSFSILLVDDAFLTTDIKSELEDLKNNDSANLKRIVILSRLDQSEPFRNWSIADGIHLRNQSLSSLIDSFSELFELRTDLSDL